MQMGDGPSNEPLVVSETDHSNHNHNDTHPDAHETTTAAIMGRTEDSLFPHALSWSWATDLRGSEYIALVLWIGKDWSWSQLGWNISAVVLGTAALVWIWGIGLSQAWTARLYSEVYKTVLVGLWLVGLYAWMMGEFGTLWCSTDIDPHALVYEARGNTVARWVLLTAVLTFVVLYAVLIPWDVFAADRQHVLVQHWDETSPSFPARGYFREFRMYAWLHFFTWILVLSLHR